MKNFDEFKLNERDSLKTKWIETPEYELKRKLRKDYQYKFYGNKQKITNEVLYMMMMDVIERLDQIERTISRNQDEILTNQDEILTNQDGDHIDQDDLRF